MTVVYTITGRTPATGYPITSATVTVSDWNGYRLPTEMEWMWAAMGATAGTTGYSKAFSGSTGSNAIGDYAVYDYYGSGVGRTTTERTNPVGSKLPNELSLYDMSGNVWEWCWDQWDGIMPYPDGTLTDYKSASGTDRVVRGGSWDGPDGEATVAYRYNRGPIAQDSSIGFRVVRP